jgi:hypothetical protein
MVLVDPEKETADGCWPVRGSVPSREMEAT